MPCGVQIEFGGECHISGRPYTVFRWKPGSDARYALSPSPPPPPPPLPAAHLLIHGREHLALLRFRMVLRLQ